MNRWISSVFCTFALLCLLFFMPSWNFTAKTPTKIQNFQDAQISHVTVTRKIRAVKHYKQNPQKPVVQEYKKTIPSPDAIVKEEVKEIEKFEEPVEQEPVQDEVVDAQSQNAQPVQSAINGIEGTKEYSTYKQYVLSRIATKKIYPSGARSKNQRGKVKVQLVINSDGTVSNATILVPSEYSLLNEATLQTIKKASPFKKMPKGMDKLSLTFVMDYSLN